MATSPPPVIVIIISPNKMSQLGLSMLVSTHSVMSHVTVLGLIRVTIGASLTFNQAVFYKNKRNLL